MENKLNEIGNSFIKTYKTKIGSILKNMKKDLKSYTKENKEKKENIEKMKNAIIEYEELHKKIVPILKSKFINPPRDGMDEYIFDELGPELDSISEIFYELFSPQNDSEIAL